MRGGAARHAPAILLVLCSSLATADRLTVNGSVLWRDGAPFKSHGIAYTPTPIGHRPEDRILDYFGPDYNSTWQRDLQLLEALGANLLRIYAFDPSINHDGFFDGCVARNMTIMGGMDLMPSTHDLSTEKGIKVAELELFTQLDSLFPGGTAHEAVGIWAVGNELNAEWKVRHGHRPPLSTAPRARQPLGPRALRWPSECARRRAALKGLGVLQPEPPVPTERYTRAHRPWQGFTCDEDSSYAPCQLGANSTALFRALDRLCATVVSF
eukprot:4179975-Prymnesium_polylepis.1